MNNNVILMLKSFSVLVFLMAIGLTWFWVSNIYQYGFSGEVDVFIAALFSIFYFLAWVIWPKSKKTNQVKEYHETASSSRYIMNLLAIVIFLLIVIFIAYFIGEMD